jgi:hypothetical protein
MAYISYIAYSFTAAPTKRLLTFPTALSKQQLIHSPQLTTTFSKAIAQPNRANVSTNYKGQVLLWLLFIVSF